MKHMGSEPSSNMGRNSVAISAVILALALVVSTEAPARNLRGIDALRDAAPVGKSLEQNQSAKKGDVTAQTQFDSRLGVPTFLWGQASGAAANLSAAAAASSDPVPVARAYLTGLGTQYRLSSADVAQLPVLLTQTMPNGATLVKFRNRINDIEVFREDAAVLLGADRSLVAIGGYVMSGDGTAPFKLSAASAAEAALGDWSFAAGTASALVATVNRDGYQHYALPDGTLSADGSQLAIPVRTKPVLFRLPNRLVPAYYVEVQVRDGRIPFGLDSYAYVVSAEDSTVLYRNNQTADVAFSYKVFAEAGPSFLPLPSPTGRNGFPHPMGVADGYQGPFVTPNLVTLQNFPFSRNDPWLAPGATTTTGNNVDAFADLVAPEDFQAGDLRPTTTSSTTFDRTYNTAVAPNVTNDQIMASVTNLFYMNNFLHDWFYDSGFDEVSGNAQTDNFGRGGAANDPIFAEGQDYAALNNANMATPADGGRPRMRMYVFSGAGAQLVRITAPAAIAGAKTGALANFGAQTYDLTNNVVAALPADGCTALTNGVAVSGKIALIDRGACSFVIKVKNAQNAGAIGVIVANIVAGAPTAMGGTDATITIPSQQISQSDGAAIKAQLALPAVVTARMARVVGVNRDGTLDNGVIAHEWGHYISNRLVGNANGLSTNLAAGMGEGWADFHALLLLAKASDASILSNANFAGTYAIGGYLSGGPDFAPDALNNGFYAGIRRYPYSRDLTKNPLSFRHIANGVTLPASPPPAFGADGASNSEVHNTGEVWGTMLWECYSNLLNDTLGASPRLTFAQAQDRMKRYLVAGYKLTPSAPTMIEARDALLAAMLAQDQTDYARCYAGFAKRGAGVGAVSPDRYSSDNSGVVESAVVGGALSIVGVTITDSPAFCDGDNILDNGETGTMTVTLRNVGTIPLSATTGGVSSSNAHVSFPNGAGLTIASTVPQQTITLTLPVRLTAASGVETADIAVSVDDPQLATVRPYVGHVLFRVNADQKANQSATDDVESTHTVWTTGSSVASPAPNLLWQRSAISGLDHRWVGPDSGTSQLTWLQSPPLTVAATGNFSFTFRHRFSFEFDTSGNYDGGQIQISTDNGVSWTSIGASAAPTYNGTLLAYTGNTNPLQGLTAYVKQNAAYPALETVTVSLGTAYAGQTVRVRFAIGTDLSGAGGGWEVDDIAFTNITNTPFDSIVAHAGACYSLTAQAGTPQSTTVNTAFPTALKVLVKDGGGVPVPGASVTFTAPTTGASAAFASASAVLANASGVATATTLTANGVAGSYQATATVGLQSAVFLLRNKLACSLDLDDDGVVLAHTDALLLARYIANALPNVDLTANAKNPTSVVPASTIQAAVEAMRSGLFVDVDGDNVVDSKDALIVLRALLGFRDTGLTDGLALGSSARKTGAALNAWLVTNCGLTLP